MPKYDYRCTACGHIYEKREGFEAPSVQECPTCRGLARRVLTPPAIVFKGSGWYKTDSRAPEPAASATDSKTDAKSESTTESKSASTVSEAAAAD